MHAKRHPIRLEYWAGCDADGRLTALRVRGIGDSRRLRQRRHEGARARRRPRQRAVPRAGDRRRDDRGPHQQPRVRGVPRVRRQPGAVRHGRRARPARRAGRHQRLGDPQAQRDPPRRRCGARARSWTTAPAAPRPASTRSSRPTTRRVAAGKAVGLGLGLKNSGLGNGFREVCGRGRALPRRRRARRGSPRLDRDGPGRAHGGAAGRGAGARHRPGRAST